MSKPIRIVLIVLGAVIGLMVIGAITISLLFDPNDYKDTMTAEVKARTGRTLTIGDDISLTFFPWLGVKTGNATFAAFDTSSDQQLADLSARTSRQLDESGGWLPVAGALGILAGVLAAVCAWWGVSQRLEEYR